MSRQRNLLHPEMQKKATEFEALCKKSGLNVLITETFRSTAEQNVLYAKGRTTSGKIVTNAKGDSYQSPHQWGCAFDFCENVKGKEYASQSFFKKCGAIGKSLGLFWGGDFISFVDTPHLELPKYIVNKSTATLKAKYTTPEKFIATWTGSHGHKVVVKPVVYQTLKVGSKGNNVKDLQKLLNNNGAKIVADGMFGAKTTEAVKKYQKAKGLKVDGIAGNATITKLVQGK
jgi:peptidoglycan L-alanyl-D-glutamate endopeptidase CwlK